jgi:hemoglobin
MARMVDHQTKFIASLLGGPVAYNDNQLRKMHARLNVADTHFDELKRILRATLENHGFDKQDVATVLSGFERRRGLIVS